MKQRHYFLIVFLSGIITLTLTQFIIPNKVVGMGYTRANGSLTLEAKNIENIYREIQKIASQYKAITKNYNVRTDPNTKKKTLNVNFTLARSKASLFMNDIALLGDVQSQNYNEYKSYYNLETLKKKLESYEKQLEKVLSSSAPDSEIVKLFNQQIQNVENQIRNAERETSKDGANINVSLIEREYNVKSSRGLKDITLNTIITGVVAIVFFFLGFFISGSFGQKKKKINSL